MKDNACKTPCLDCPFRKSSLPGWLGDYTAEELYAIVMNEMPFACHMTHDRDLKWEETGSKEYPFCAGALMFMKQAGKLPRDKRIRDLVSKVNREDCDNILSPPDFLSHHKKFVTKKNTGT